MKDRVAHLPVTPASDESFKRIIDRFIDKKLQEGPQMKSVIQRIVNETKVLYEHSMKKSQCKFCIVQNKHAKDCFIIYSATRSRCPKS
jgi:hypothetical protein